MSLSRVEFRLLYLMVINQGQVVPFQKLKNYACKIAFTVAQHELYVYISRFRKKLDDEAHPRSVHL
ncbi:helix-turn-helix domain-containing protein [Paenibacillus thiaminolyticus]|uniref:helix-turn-helix domain-containing protein n=1 Tax=Paenibacillus thiaminolyticus TaxID=49283 RepID=UPI0035A6A6C4